MSNAAFDALYDTLEDVTRTIEATRLVIAEGDLPVTHNGSQTVLIQLHELHQQVDALRDDLLGKRNQLAVLN